MIFYIANKATGGRQVCTTQGEAKPIDKDYVQLDIPTDKAGLRDAIQELLDLADAAGSTETQEAENVPESPQIEAQGTDVTGMSREQRDEAFFPTTPAPSGRPAVDMTSLSREERKKLCYPRNVDLLDREYFQEVWSQMPMPLRLDLISSAMGNFRQFWIQQTKANQAPEQPVPISGQE